MPVGRAAACSLRVRVTTVCIAAVAGVTASLRWSMSGCRPETKTFTAAMQVGVAEEEKEKEEKEEKEEERGG